MRRRIFWVGSVHDLHWSKLYRFYDEESAVQRARALNASLQRPEFSVKMRDDEDANWELVYSPEHDVADDDQESEDETDVDGEDIDELPAEDDTDQRREVSWDDSDE